ncbi:hypothetical protein F2Q70_00030628 [Brassica cretica]|uniref:Uncharacterized protein n=1 Tax=Brassica cretica TaxID=69181 RepID=A0A8S9N174_BRACR|nr:hypothetical protein F2Q70_00030628 [Brassica cretica]KAF3487638.1 hypothetical protein F2Q69_00054004 [Brassica cretica]
MLRHSQQPHFHRRKASNQERYTIKPAKQEQQDMTIFSSTCHRLYEWLKEPPTKP